MMKTFAIKEEKGYLPYMIFFQSLGGWPEFKLYETFEAAEKAMKYLQSVRLKSALYLNLSRTEIKEGE